MDPACPVIEHIQQVEDFAAAYLAVNQSTRAVPERRFYEIPDGHGRNKDNSGPIPLLLSRLEAKDIRVIDLELDGVFDDAQAPVSEYSLRAPWRWSFCRYPFHR